MRVYRDRWGGGLNGQDENEERTLINESAFSWLDRVDLDPIFSLPAL